MIDAEQYTSILLDSTFAAAEPDFDSYGIAPDTDTPQMVGDFPQLIWNLRGDGEPANGPGLWSFTLTGNFFGAGMDQAKAFARIGYDVITGWNDDPAATARPVDGDWIVCAGVEDIDLPTRVAQSDIDGRLIVQYSGSWSLLLRQA